MVGGWFPRGSRNTNRNKFNIRFFRYSTLRIATKDFSTLIGQGGFGSVFKGVLPNDGRIVAIKKFSTPPERFLEMAELMSSLRHVNLIQVIGCCVENGEQLLVSEFAENGSVDNHLHGVNTPASFDNWERRAAVCIGTARGLSYLHEEINPGIIHRDVKPSNIVLDANFVPKIVDFDLIHFVDVKGEKRTALESNEFAHLGVEYLSTTTTIQGTIGYIEPNYMATGQLTEKADVYGFGVVMLEIITGRKPFELARQQRQIVDWVTRAMKDGTGLNIVDPKLTDFPEEDVERFINVALLCTQPIPKQRPSMFEVVHMLYGRQKSNHQEISDMATRVIADQPDRCNSSAYDVRTPVSICSLTISLDGRGGSTSIWTDYAAEMESREEPADELGRGNSCWFIDINRSGDVSHTQGECSASEAALAPVETRLASSSQEDQILPEMESRKEPGNELGRGNSDSFIVVNRSDVSHSQGECSASEAALAPVETALASSSQEDVVRAYFERSMEKIMRYQVAKRRNRSDRATIMTQTIVTKKSSGNMFLEAVYPPFLTGEYRSSRVLYSGRPAPL